MSITLKGFLYGLWLHYQVVTIAYALIHQAQASPQTPPNGNSKDDSCSNIVDVKNLKQTIKSGRVYQHPNFLSEEEVQLLWKEINDLETSGAFTRSGLSNLARGAQQQFGNKDRSLCPVPWWQETLEGKPVTNTQQEGMQTIATRLQDLRLALSDILDRPTMTDASLAHECYYSMSTVGSYLPRHMDERHEELKGAKGWLLPSRRSLSWLVYLSEPEDWSLERNGGALRTFPPKSIANNALSLTHDEGNLQIGWLFGDSTGTGKDARPVYLDSWYPVVAQPNTPPEPHCILYTREDPGKEKRILTLPWITENIQGVSIPEFLMTWAQRQSSGDISEGLFLRPQDAQQFALLEDRTAWDNGKIPEGSIVEDIAPLRGSLVVFDSVTLPHQVETIQQGRRVALAGWFHEETQPFPEAMYS